MKRIVQFSVQENGDIYALCTNGQLWLRKANEPEVWFPIEGPTE